MCGSRGCHKTLEPSSSPGGWNSIFGGVIYDAFGGVVFGVFNGVRSVNGVVVVSYGSDSCGVVVVVLVLNKNEFE